MLAIDIAHFLDNKGIGVYDEVGISGDIFIGSVPDAPDEVVTIRPTGGTRTDPAQPYDKPTVQVIVRGRLDPRTASDRAQSVFDALNGFRGGLLVAGGPWIVGCQAMQSGPIHIGQDANGRHEYSINFELQILNTTREVT